MRWDIYSQEAESSRGSREYIDIGTVSCVVQIKMRLDTHTHITRWPKKILLPTMWSGPTFNYF